MCVPIPATWTAVDETSIQGPIRQMRLPCISCIGKHLRGSELSNSMSRGYDKLITSEGQAKRVERGIVSAFHEGSSLSRVRWGVSKPRQCLRRARAERDASAEVGR